MRATWKGKKIAESNETIVVRVVMGWMLEANHVS